MIYIFFFIKEQKLKMDILKTFCKTHKISGISYCDNFTLIKTKCLEKYDFETTTILIEDLIMKIFPPSIQGEYKNYSEYNQKNSLYNVLYEGINKGIINNSSIKKIINDFNPKFIEENRYLLIWVDGQSAIHLTHHFKKGKEKYCTDYEFETFLGLHITNFFVSDWPIYNVAEHIILSFLDYFFYESVTRPDRLKYAISYIFPEYSTIELDFCKENRCNEYTLIIKTKPFLKNGEKYILLNKQKDESDIDKLTMDALNGINIKLDGSYLPFKTQLSIVYNIYMKLENKINKERLEILKSSSLSNDVVDNIVRKFLYR